MRRFERCKSLAMAVFAATAIVLAGCSSAVPAATPVQAQPATSQPANKPSQPAAQQPLVPGGSAAGQPAAAPSTLPPATSGSRLDVIYSHMTQRCPTCLCFEERINTVVEKYFKDAIASGKMTYTVVNAQEPQNAAFARKFKAVGSQLFLDRILNGFDNIDDIQDIWNWDCRTKGDSFEQKVKYEIEQRLNG